MFLDPLPDYLEGEVELLVACLGLVEAGLGEPVGSAILERLVGLVEHLRGHCPVEVGDRSLEVAVIDVQVEVTRQVSPRIVVDVEELLSLSCQLLRHLRKIRETLKVVRGETHVSFEFTLINAFCQDVASVSLDVLVELNGDEVVAADQLAEVRDFYCYIFALSIDDGLRLVVFSRCT